MLVYETDELDFLSHFLQVCLLVRLILKTCHGLIHYWPTICEATLQKCVRYFSILSENLCLQYDPSVEYSLQLLPWFEAAAKEVILRSMVKPDPDALLHEIQIQLIGFNRCGKNS